MRAYLRRHPTIAFFALVFGVSWTMSVVQLLVPPSTGGAPSPAQIAGTVISALALRIELLSPALAGVVMSWAVRGRSGLRDLAARCTLWRVGWRWYAIVLVAFPLVFGSAIVLAVAITGAGNPVAAPVGWQMWVLMPLLVALGGPLHEELGWRGFALPRLMDRFGDLSASVILGVLWAAWHWQPWELPQMFARYSAAEVFLPNQLAAVALAVVMTWVYRNTGGSVLVAGFGMHLAANLVLAVVSTSIEVITPAAVTWGQTAGLAACAVAIVVRYGPGRFSRQQVPAPRAGAPEAHAGRYN